MIGLDKFSESELPWHNASLYLTRNPQYMSLVHNEHKSYYETVTQIAESRDWNWISEEEKQLAIKHDDVWELQWYPDTPVGSYCIAGYNLDKVLEYARNIKDG